MSTSKDRINAELDEITAEAKTGRAALKKARPVVRRALKAGIPAAELVGRPYSRATVYNIQQEMKDRGELPDD